MPWYHFLSLIPLTLSLPFLSHMGEDRHSVSILGMNFHLQNISLHAYGTRELWFRGKGDIHTLRDWRVGVFVTGPDPGNTFLR